MAQEFVEPQTETPAPRANMLVSVQTDSVVLEEGNPGLLVHETVANVDGQATLIQHILKREAEIHAASALFSLSSISASTSMSAIGASLEISHDVGASTGSDSEREHATKYFCGSLQA
ncbi:hypothetical protein TraAM80_01035 [Trypanosoma rangeli]|uniref:Uncharacterized protein n=1 Tax=Trypanosoma rangeli TaxID=5698 RepID=A0A422P0K6_TRYRA|nr:uncharacterized protein TraAM80_01035 [Trypanosoma rangeli]RNF11247.1 hypothetical protein TraAM80_01035 [Trypanosoma rangeli]|eukprot:RNF11247.1 hypothetical protein TraAM80_01035 [Trypanosoma rangeli]